MLIGGITNVIPLHSGRVHDTKLKLVAFLSWQATDIHTDIWKQMLAKQFLTATKKTPYSFIFQKLFMFLDFVA